MASSFKNASFCFVVSKRKSDVEAVLHAMGILGRRWEVVDDLTVDEVDAVAERISKAEHAARMNALRATREGTKAMASLVARDLATRMRTPARQVLIRIDEGP